MNTITKLFTLALLMVLPLVARASGMEGVDSLKIYIEAGDSCMKQFNTFEALKYYQKAYDISKNDDDTHAAEHAVTPYTIRMKLADC